MFSAVNGWVKLLLLLVGFLCFLAGGWWLYFLHQKEVGRQEWARVKAELAAKGEKLDWKSFIPEPVPDELNFAKAPGVREIIRREGSPSDLKRRVSSWGISGLTSHLADPDKQHRSDIEAIAEGLSFSASTDPTNTRSAAEAIQAWAGTNATDLKLIELAALRPMTQFEVNPTNGFAPPSLNFVSMRQVAQTAALLAAADLAAGNGAEALNRLRVNFAMSRGLENGVTLVEAMIGVAIDRVSLPVVWEGLVDHMWNEEQLVELD